MDATVQPEVRTHTFTFSIKSIRVGEYFPVEVEPVEGQVALDVPVTPEFIHNYAKLDISTEAPVLTLRGLRWCYNQLRSAFLQTNEPPASDDESSENNSDEWV